MGNKILSHQRSKNDVFEIWIRILYKFLNPFSSFSASWMTLFKPKPISTFVIIYLFLFITNPVIKFNLRIFMIIAFFLPDFD